RARCWCLRRRSSSAKERGPRAPPSTSRSRASSSRSSSQRASSSSIDPGTRQESALRVNELRYRELFEEAQKARLTLARQNEQLHELDKLKDEVIALVSHELRTPLTSIIGYIELVLDSEPTSEQCLLLGVAERNSHRLLRLVNDLLFVAQVQAGK